MKIIAASVEQPVIEKILTHLGLHARALPRSPARGQAPRWPERSQPPSIERIRAELKRAMAQPEIVDKFVQGSLVPAYSAPDVFETQVRSDVERFGRLVKAIGIQLQ